MTNMQNSNAKVPSSDNTTNEEYEDEFSQGTDITEESEEGIWLQRAKDAYRASTSYVDTNYRGQWEMSIDLFNNTHPADSKYNMPQFDKRSKIFRPKTRAIIRKTEASGAAAYFSNQDIINVQAVNSSIPEHVAGASIMKQLVQYRLNKSVKWFQTIMGALQDAQVVGACCAHVYWDRQIQANDQDKPEEKDELPVIPGDGPNPNLRGFSGETLSAPGINSIKGNDSFGPFNSEKETQLAKNKSERVIKDEPCIDLISIENIRIDPACSWIDPINSSPFVIELIPMYVCDVKRKMANREWRKFGNETIMSASENKGSTTVQVRHKNKQNPYDSDVKEITDYATVWIQRHIHRDDTDDFEFYTLGDKELLTTPRPLKDSVFHGKRPYVIGNCLVETHKPFPSSVPELAKGLQDEANEIANQRLDNVKFVLNKRYIIKRNKQVDVNALLKNVPGGIVAVDDIEKDIRELNYPDVTQSSYAEQDRINVDMDELLGNFSASSVGSNRQVGETAKGMALMNQSANIVTEYLLRTFTETFVEPVLRLMVLLEQHYETDLTVIGIAGQKAQTFEKFGINQNLDQLLDHELTLNVNVGMGATDPIQKVNKLTMGLMTLKNVIGPGFETMVNVEEVTKEIMGALGYDDGERFLKQGANPQLAQAMKVIQQLQMKVKNKEDETKARLMIAKDNNQTKLVLAGHKETQHNQRFLVDHFFNKQHEVAMLSQDQTMKPKGAKDISDKADQQASAAPAAAPSGVSPGPNPPAGV